MRLPRDDAEDADDDDPEGTVCSPGKYFLTTVLSEAKTSTGLGLFGSWRVKCVLIELGSLDTS